MAQVEREVPPPKPVKAGPWNPGLESSLPRAFLPLATVFRTENVETGLDDAGEMSDVSGLPLIQMVSFRPHRLVVHEVLVRVMADLSVPVGRTYGDLGVNFRAIVSTILRDGIASHADEIAAMLDRIRADTAVILARELAAMLDGPAAIEAGQDRSSLWHAVFGTPRPAGASTRPAHRRSWRFAISTHGRSDAAHRAMPSRRPPAPLSAPSPPA